MINIKGKNALVTGSSRGVGQQLAIGLAKLGCNVIVHGRTKESCVQTLELLKNYNVSTYSVNGELSDETAVDNLIKQVKELEIQIDILYNNAAIMPPYHEDIWKHSWDEWTKSHDMTITVRKPFSVTIKVVNNSDQVIEGAIVVKPLLASILLSSN